MIAIAKSRTKSLGLDSSLIEFGGSDAEILDFPKSAFTAILSRQGLMFVSNLPITLKTNWQFLIPDGRLAATAWSAPSKVPN